MPLTRRVRVRVRARAYQRAFVNEWPIRLPARFTWSAVDGSPRMYRAQRTFAATHPLPSLFRLCRDQSFPPLSLVPRSFDSHLRATRSNEIFEKKEREREREREREKRWLPFFFSSSCFSSYTRGKGEVGARGWPTRGDPLSLPPRPENFGGRAIEARQLHERRERVAQGGRLLGLGLGQRQPFAGALPQARVRGRVRERRRGWKWELREGGAGGAERRRVVERGGWK